MGKHENYPMWPLLYRKMVLITISKNLKALFRKVLTYPTLKGEHEMNKSLHQIEKTVNEWNFDKKARNNFYAKHLNKCRQKRSPKNSRAVRLKRNSKVLYELSRAFPLHAQGLAIFAKAFFFILVMNSGICFPNLLAPFCPWSQYLSVPWLL